MDKLIEAMPVERDADGSWWHPGMLQFDEGQELEAKNWLQAQQLTVSRNWLEHVSEEHPAYIAIFEDGDGNFSAWVDEPPKGEGWFTLAIYDTEDGPVWCWARRLNGGVA